MTEYKKIGVAALAVSTLLSPAVAEAKQSAKPNIVVILVDDLGFSDLGCYGGEISTPNIDRLASKGVRVTQFVNSSKSAPSRASLLTGLTSLELGNDGPPIQMVNGITIAEMLKSKSNYTTLMAGKWHAKETPTNRGFDHYCGIERGSTNYYGINSKMELIRDGEVVPREQIEGGVGNFFTTEFYTDRALEYIDRYSADENPYFLFLAYNAPHYPLQAEESDVAKYRGKYMKGWDAIREERFARQQKMGIVPKGTKLSERDKKVPAWSDFEAKEAADLTMATYAAMVETLDKSVGRVIEKIEKSGEADNTLIMLFSDNGACNEGEMWDGVDPKKRPGTKQSQARLGTEWANACNTPYRTYKRDLMNGGQCTPFIARWDGVIKDKGAIYHREAHIIDIYPTIMELAGVKMSDYPAGEVWKNPTPSKAFKSEWKVAPLSGVSIMPMLTKGEALGRERPLVGYFQGNYFIRKGGWKLVTNWKDELKNRANPKWYLFDIRKDAAETTDLSKSHPEVAAELRAEFEAWKLKANIWGQIFDENGNVKQREKRSK
ncbi:MAG: arylsulfatase [Rikenellaceae bacterium]